MHVSIVMAYVNRKAQIDFTLRTLCQSEHKDFDVIVVDDVSSTDQQLDNLAEEYSSQFPIKLIKIRPEEKWHSNPCIPYNIGFREAKGDIILIQNPECCLRGDVISASLNIDENTYLVFQTYGASQELTNKLHLLPDNDLFNGIDFCLNPKVVQQNWALNLGWYCHHIYRPFPWHFATAITRNNLRKLRGFDERYAIGIQFDDDEFLERIIRLGLTIKFVVDENLYAVHQWHDPCESFIQQFWERAEYNRKIYMERTLKENIYAAPENKYFNDISTF